MPTGSAPDVIQIINFVYETKRVANFEPKISSVYRVHYVTCGSAMVQCGSLRREVKRGDVFFIFPSIPYVIEGQEDFKYLYISFIGIRANMLTERLGIGSRSFVYEGFENLESLWREGIEASPETVDLAGESVLLYTLMHIGNRTHDKETDHPVHANVERFLLVKKYIDDNFSDCALSLDRIGAEFAYNKKYLSTAFKKHFKIGITEYLNTVRINHACILMDQNYTSVSDIAYLCGYDDPMYFSRVFKKKMGVPPREYMK